MNYLFNQEQELYIIFGHVLDHHKLFLFDVLEYQILNDAPMNTVLESELTCLICDGEIMVYYEERYQGTRGKCTDCSINFPLE